MSAAGQLQFTLECQQLGLWRPEAASNKGPPGGRPRDGALMLLPRSGAFTCDRISLATVIHTARSDISGQGSIILLQGSNIRYSQTVIQSTTLVLFSLEVIVPSFLGCLVFSRCITISSMFHQSCETEASNTLGNGSCCVGGFGCHCYVFSLGDIPPWSPAFCVRADALCSGSAPQLSSSNFPSPLSQEFSLLSPLLVLLVKRKTR